MELITKKMVFNESWWKYNKQLTYFLWKLSMNFILKLLIQFSIICESTFTVNFSLMLSMKNKTTNYHTCTPYCTPYNASKDLLPSSQGSSLKEIQICQFWDISFLAGCGLDETGWTFCKHSILHLWFLHISEIYFEWNYQP